MTESDHHRLLLGLGLSEKETKCYLVLLKVGALSTSAIAKRAGMNRGTTYTALHRLLSLGLVAKSEKGGHQVFSVLSPDRLRIVLQDRRNLLERQAEELEECLPQLKNLRQPISRQPKVQYLDGPAGLQSFLESIIESDEKDVCAYAAIHDLKEVVGAKAFLDYTRRRAANGVRLRVIQSIPRDARDELNETVGEALVSDAKALREVRRLTDEVLFSGSMYTFDNKVALLSDSEEQFAVVIESAALADSQKRIFSWVWQVLEQETGVAAGRGQQ